MYLITLYYLIDETIHFFFKFTSVGKSPKQLIDELIGPTKYVFQTRN